MIDKVKEPFLYSFIVTKNWRDIWVRDPYSKYNHRNKKWGEFDDHTRCLYINNIEFDWSDDKKPNHSYNDLIIYELHVVYINLK